MRDPIKQVETLTTWLEEIRDTFPLKEKPKARFQGMIDALSSILEELKDLSDTFDIVLPSEEDPFELYKEWSTSAAGRIGSSSPLFEKIVGHSPTLKYLSLGGIETKGITRYSEAELYFSKVIGDNYKDSKNIIHWIAAAIHHIKGKSDSFVTCNAYFFPNYIRLIKQLSHNSEPAIDILKIEVEQEDKSFLEVPQADALKIVGKIKDKDKRIRIYFKIPHDELRQLIIGDWFNAYAYQVITQHLSLNRMNYELFTKVEYRAPAEISRFGSDFDLIGTIGDKIIFVESKSGKIDKESLIKEIVERTKKIKEIFDKAKAGETRFMSILIYNSGLKENKDVKENVNEQVTKLGAPSILVIDPTDIRGMITELVRE